MPATDNVGRFQFTGQAWIPEVKLYYFKARFYSASLGRFMQTDPIGYAAGMNLYAYVSGDVINMRDPTGLMNDFLNDIGGVIERVTVNGQYDCGFFCIGFDPITFFQDFTSTLGDFGLGIERFMESAQSQAAEQRSRLPPCDPSNVPDLDVTSQIGLYAAAGVVARPFGVKVNADAEANLLSYNTPLSGEPYWNSSFGVEVGFHKLRIGFSFERRSYNGGLSWQASPTNFSLFDLNASTDGSSLEFRPPQALAGFSASLSNVSGLAPTGSAQQCRTEP